MTENQRKPITFLLVGDHIIICNTTYFTNKRTDKSKWLHYQIEFPKQGLQCFLDILEGKFFKTDAEGGLAKGTFNSEGLIDG